MFQLYGMVGLTKSTYNLRGWLRQLGFGAHREAGGVAAGEVSHGYARRRAQRTHARRFVVYARDRIALDHLDRMTDSTGLIQHAIYSIPRRESGYTTDDNARALRLSRACGSSSRGTACSAG